MIDKIRLTTMFVLFGCTLFISCGKEEDSLVETLNDYNEFDENIYENFDLVWSEEFDKPGLPDTTYWNYEEGYIRNQELQYYEAGNPKNTWVSNGKLNIIATCDSYNYSIKSGSINTYNKVDFLYGRIDVLAKLPHGRGLWAAIWTLGKKRNEGVPYPYCGEIDIMEFVGYSPDFIHFNMHFPAAENANKSVCVPSNTRAFSLYSIEWTPAKVSFFINNILHFTCHKRKGDTWPFDEPHYLLLNLAVGGSWGGAYGIDYSVFPSHYQIDYVRYYKLKELKIE